MKKISKLFIILPTLLGVSSLVSCKNNDSTDNNPNKPNIPDIPVSPEDDFDPILIKPLLSSLNTEKNYTYTYEKFHRKDKNSEFVSQYKYEDKFTKTDMYSKAISDEDEAINFGWTTNKTDGTFRVLIDNKETITPQKALRDINRNIVPTYFDQILAIDDVKYTTKDNFELFEKNHQYKLKDPTDKKVILEASQVLEMASDFNKTLVTMDCSNKKAIKVKAIVGQNDYVEGVITDIGTTKIPLLEKYREEGKGALIQDTVDPKFQKIIDNFKAYNYETGLYGVDIGLGQRPLVGLSKIYKTKSKDGTKEAIVKFDDYEKNDENTKDEGLIQLTEKGRSDVYKFSLDEEGKLVLGDLYSLQNKTYNYFDDFYLLPTSLTAFNEDAPILNYNEEEDTFVTYDKFIAYETCFFFGFEKTVEFALPYCVTYAPTYDEAKNLDLFYLTYYWDEGLPNFYPESNLIYQNFGKVSLPFVDEFLEAR